MTQPISPFNLGAAPLKGIFLLEANAGTGKTFSLSGLFLKFLYFEETLSVKNLAAITFTKAATQEIFSRIKGDLEHFLQLIDNPHSIPPEEKRKLSFEYLLQDYHTLSPARQQAKRDHLLKNLLNFDEHNIHTIHGFAGKIIREYRLELGIGAGEEITQDDSFFFEEAFRDFWRKYCLDLDPCFLVYFETHYPLKKWKEILKTFYRQPSLAAYPLPQGDPLGEWENAIGYKRDFSRWGEEILSRWEETCAWLPQGIEEDLLILLEQEVLNKNKTQNLIERWRRLERYFRNGRLIPFLYDFFLEPDLLIRFSKEKFHTCFKKNSIPEDYLKGQLQEVLSRLEDMASSLNRIGAAYQELAFQILHASDRFIKKRSRELRERMGILSFNDLLEILAHHIESPQGEYLLNELARIFRIILIDEFQDTDPLQYTIFQKLLPRVQAVYFIADPKQSIYGFRQANIHTYFQARKSMDQIFHLLSNYRSDPQLLEGVNHLYTHHPAPFFIPELVYHPSTTGLEGKGEEKPIRIIFSKYDEPLNTGASREMTIRLLAQSIQKEMEQSPSRIAVLVRKRQQGILIYDFLRAQGIPAQMENPDTLFETQEARDLYLFLKALIACDDDLPRHINTFRDARLLGALSTPLFLKEKIYQKNPYSEEILQDWLLKFRRAYREWKERGWYVMFHRFMREERIPSHLLGQEDGIHRYQNLLFLTDLLHNWETTLDRGAPQPERLFHRFIAGLEGDSSPNISNYPNRDRTEMTTEGIRITTIHKSKGLEYDIVYLPFSDENLFLTPRNIIFKLKEKIQGQGSNLAYDLGSEQKEEHKILSEQETLAEELRLLYVSLTRAKRKLFLYISPNKKHYPLSPLGYLLHPPSESHPKTEYLWQYFKPEKTSGKKPDDFGEKLSSWWEELAALGQHPTIAFEEITIFDQPLRKDIGSSTPEYPPFIPFHPRGKMVVSEGFHTSFTSMIQKVDSLTGSFNDREDKGVVPGERDEQIDDPGEKINMDSLDSSEIDDPLSGLSAGAATGLFLHEVLEQMDFNHSDPTYLRDVLLYPGQKYFGELFQLRGNSFNLWAHENLPKLIAMLERVQNLEIPFPKNPISLKRVFLTPQAAIREMEFTLHFPGSEEVLQNRLFSHLKENGLFPPLETTPNPEGLVVFRNGYLKGFIDLVFRYEGKYYLLDWKSNQLGNRIIDYEEDHLHRAMVESHYYLQAYLYSLALDRYLSLRLGDSYDYENCFGGFAYVFLRGIRHNGVITYKPPYSTILTWRKWFSPITKGGD